MLPNKEDLSQQLLEASPQAESFRSRRGDPEPTHSCIRAIRLIVVVAVVSVGTSFQFGFGTGILNNLEQVAPASLAADDCPIALWQWSLVVSGFGLGGLVGSFAVSHVSLRFGRKTVLLATNAFVIASSALLMIATAWPLLLLGRICMGIVAGIGSAVVPMYFAEISPTSVRAVVGTAHQVGITLGCLVSLVLTTPSLHLLGEITTWRYAFLVPIFCSLLECIVLPFCAESPVHLYRTSGSAAALRNLAELHTSGSIGGHIDALRNEAQLLDAPSEGGFTLQELISARKLRRQLLVGIVIQVSMQLSGIDAVFFYSTLAFRQAGLHDPQMATTYLGILNVLLTVVAIYVMDRAGRRTLLLISWCGMCMSYTVLTLSFLFASYGVMTEMMHTVAVIAMGGVITSFAIGPGVSALHTPSPHHFFCTLCSPRIRFCTVHRLVCDCRDLPRIRDRRSDGVRRHAQLVSELGRRLHLPTDKQRLRPIQLPHLCDVDVLLRAVHVSLRAGDEEQDDLRAPRRACREHELVCALPWRAVRATTITLFDYYNPGEKQQGEFIFLFVLSTSRRDTETREGPVTATVGRAGYVLTKELLPRG